MGRFPLACTLAVLLLPAVGAHSTYEAAELEVHVINDEGSDLIESYGGYDIQDVFVGFAHDPTVGVGEPDDGYLVKPGDGFYLRIELYGDRKEAQVPQGAANWSVVVHMNLAGQEMERRLWTTDGTTFASDFDALSVAIEDRDTHVLRAFISLRHAGLLPGDEMLVIDRVESRVDGDLRDIAPGGIPVPGTDGAREYEDPTAIAGEGMLEPLVKVRAPDGYLRIDLAAVGPRAYEVTVASALQEGGQHVMLGSQDLGGWRIEGPATGAVPPKGALSFRFVHDGVGQPALVAFDILTDVGGRTPVWLAPDGLHAPGVFAAAAPEPEPDSPAVGVLFAFCLLALAATRRR